MAVSRIERMLLKTMIYGELAFDPQALDPEITSEEPTQMVHDRFRQLSTEEQKPFFDYFRAKPRFPFQIYRKSHCPGSGPQNFKFHYEYDRPDRKTEVARLILAGFDISKLRGEYYTFAQLHELRRAYETGIDITPLLDNRFSRFQLKVLVPAIRRGFDVSEILDPAVPAKEMASAYYVAFERKLLSDLENQGMLKQLDALGAFDEIPEQKRKESLDDKIITAQSIFEERLQTSREQAEVKLERPQDDRPKVIDLTKHWANKQFSDGR